MEKENKEKLSIKLHYNFLFEFLDKHIVTALIIILIVGVLIYQNQLVGYGIFILVVYILYLIGRAIYGNLKCKKNIYKFYEDKLVYKRMLWDKEDRIIPYKNINEIKYNQSFLEKIFKLGTIVIFTRQKSLIEKMIVISNVRNVDIIFEKLTKIFEKYTNENDK